MEVTSTRLLPLSPPILFDTGYYNTCVPIKFAQNWKFDTPCSKGEMSSKWGLGSDLATVSPVPHLPYLARAKKTD